jgi:hypothetical protein
LSARQAALEPGVTVLSARRLGGGQEQAARMLADALGSAMAQPVELTPVLETARAQGPLTGSVASIAARLSTNAVFALAPLLREILRRRTIVLFQGNALFLAPWLRGRGHRIIAVCDAPRRDVGGLAGFRERRLFRLLSHADVVVRTFDFAGPFSGGPVIANILPAFPPAPRPFTPGPIERLLFVGRLEPDKGFDAFLDLAARMPQRAFHVYGEGRLRAMMERRALPNVVAHGQSRGWLDAPGGACLLGCAPAEACWTAGREALLHGIPLVFRPSPTGGPQAYARQTDKAQAAEELTPAAVGAALDRLEAALAADAEPLVQLWQASDPSRLAALFAQLCAG